MKKPALIIFFLLNMLIISAAQASEGLILSNPVSQNYTATIVNNNAQKDLEVPNNALWPLSNSEVPNYSYFYNGQYSIIDLKCIVNGQTSSKHMYVQYDKKAGIQSVSGQCQMQVNGHAIYIMPEWDSNPHGNIIFNLALTHNR